MKIKKTIDIEQYNTAHFLINGCQRYCVVLGAEPGGELMVLYLWNPTARDGDPEFVTQWVDAQCITRPGLLTNNLEDALSSVIRCSEKGFKNLPWNP